MTVKVAWVSTWNVKCGIASHLSHLLETVPADDLVICAARSSATLRPDESNCLRNWGSGKDSNGLMQVASDLHALSVRAIVIEFNYGFFNHGELDDFIRTVTLRGASVIMHLHSTVDPLPERNWQLSGFLEGLKQCKRILVHTPLDMNRLKAVGLIDNVKLMPHGVVKRARATRKPATHGREPLVASFGFSFENKGLIQLVEAVSILRDKGEKVRLRMLNAEHPDPKTRSRDVVQSVRESIDRYSLRDAVELRSDFLEDELCLELLSDADLVVNPYQSSGESASGSVRYGLTAGRPVAVTPLSIFDDLGEAVFRLPGISPRDLAEGIASALQQIRADTASAQRIRDTASRWLDAHDITQQGARLMRLSQTLSAESSGLQSSRTVAL